MILEEIFTIHNIRYNMSVCKETSSKKVVEKLFNCNKNKLFSTKKEDKQTKKQSVQMFSFLQFLGWNRLPEKLQK